MSDILHMQVALSQPVAAVFAALTENEQLEKWFSEHADVSLPDKRYNFWGRFTPEDVPEEAGNNPLVEAIPNEKLVFDWTARQLETRVTYELRPDGAGTRLILKQTAVTPEGKFVPWVAEDFWFFSLGNLRRYLDGRPVTRCDYRSFVKGDITWSLEIKASAEEVYEAIIRPDQLERWIASDASVEPVVGGTWSIGWKDVEASKILDLTPNEKVAFEWAAWGDMPATVVTWTIAESGGKTRLTLFHSGFAPDMDAPEQEGWLNYMMRIRSMLEYGADWQPVVKELPDELANMYPKAMIDRQGWLTGAGTRP